MALYSDLLSFVDVLLRGIILAGQALVLGGLAFALLILRPLAQPLRTSLRLAAWGAAGVAATQVLSLILWIGSLADATSWPVVEAIATPFFLASVTKFLACLGFIAGCRAVHQSGRMKAGWVVMVGSALALVGGSAWMSHAATRLEDRGILLGLDALHQGAAAVWIGGLVHLFAVARREERPWPRAVLQRFSTLAMAAVATLLAGGVGLSLYYVGGIPALYGTTYGWMLGAKIALLAGLLLLGGMNFLLVRRSAPTDGVLPARLRWFLEPEIGLGTTVLFAAASLTSLPPAIDIVADRATLAEVATRFTPRWPTLSSPSIEELPIDDPLAPRTTGDIAWSEYNHHWAGLFVLAMGLLALLERTGRARWARHWPLLFLGLAGFLFVRDDPGAWPLGPMGFWESMGVASVAQHRFFVLLTVAFWVFEWRVRTGRFRSPRWALVFPLFAAVGGGFLLTHSHNLFNLKEEFLVEITHIPLGLLGIMVGWSRWLELRLPPGNPRALSWLWAGGLALIGILLLLYRES